MFWEDRLIDGSIRCCSALPEQRKQRRMKLWIPRSTFRPKQSCSRKAAPVTETGTFGHNAQFLFQPCLGRSMQHVVMHVK